MWEESKVQQMNQALKKGERSRILVEMLIDTLGGNQDDEQYNLIEELKKANDEYIEALQMLRLIAASKAEEKAKLTLVDQGKTTPL